MEENQAGEHKRSRRKMITAAVLVIVAVIAAVIIFFAVKTSAGSKSAALVYLADVIEDEDTCVLLDVDIEIGEESLQFEAQVSEAEADGTTVTCVTGGGLTFYYAGKVIYLEDGTAYRTASSSEEDSGDIDAGTLLSLIKAYYTDTSVSVSDEEDCTVYTVTLDEESGNELLELLYPSSAESGTEIGELQAALYVSDGKAEAVVISGGASGIDVHVRMDIESAGGTEIPEAVVSAIESGAGDDAPILTEELYRLAAAWNDLASGETIEADITVAADFGIFTLSEEINWLRETADGDSLNILTVNGFTFEATDEELAGGSDEVSVNPEVLISLAYETFLQGGVNFAEENGSYIYTIELTQEQLEVLIPQVIPNAADIDVTYDTGTLAAVVTDGKFAGLSVSCGGSVKILFTDVEISLDLNAEFV